MPICPECRAAYPTGTGACPRDGAALVRDGFAALAEEPVVRALPLPDVTDPLVGTTLAGRFQVTARIGHGGMGIVYRATHTVIRREVALKVLHERHADRAEVAARLMNEARLASAIRNEHIVDIFDFGQTQDGRTFVVMELLDGESLAALIRRDGALPEARAAAICMQVADALGAAHARGILHRDVKPENVFILARDGEDFVKVLDFGISKATRPAELEGDGGDEPLRLTHTGMVLGTPHYMSPEQARGEDRIDHRIDVYALGVILYECLTGEVPFRGTNYLGIISDVLSRVPLSPRELRPDLRISAAIERVTLRAMARDREARYASMADLAADLRRVLAGEPVSLLPDELQPAPTAPPRPGPSSTILFGAIAAVAVAATAATLYLASPPAPPPPSPTLAAPAPPPPAPPPPAAPAVPPTVSVHIATTPPGAEVRNGARKLGVAPLDLALARSEVPVHLTFRLDGYGETATDVIPAIEGERVEVELQPLPKPPRAKKKPGPAAKGPNAQESLPVARWPGDPGARPSHRKHP